MGLDDTNTLKLFIKKYFEKRDSSKKSGRALRMKEKLDFVNGLATGLILGILPVLLQKILENLGIHELFAYIMVLFIGLILLILSEVTRRRWIP